MPIINRIAEFHAEMTQWRHQIHAHPETAFEEHKTAELVAGLLESFGVSVDRGIARTGVIGTLKGSLPGDRAIALRADMDALRIEEQNDVPTPHAIADACTPVVTTAIPQCSSARRSTSQRPAISPAQSISSFSPPRRMRAAPG